MEDIETRVIRLETHTVRLETQMERFVSEVESEKRTRANSHASLDSKMDRIDDRLRNVERHIWMGVGALAVVDTILRLALK